MKLSILGLCFLIMNVPTSGAAQENSTTNQEQAIINLSKEKWRWMSERKVDSLAALFSDGAVFVHMGGTMSRNQELDVIRSGAIQYKHAESRTSRAPSKI